MFELTFLKVDRGKILWLSVASATICSYKFLDEGGVQKNKKLSHRENRETYISLQKCKIHLVDISIQLDHSCSVVSVPWPVYFLSIPRVFFNNKLTMN